MTLQQLSTWLRRHRFDVALLLLLSGYSLVSRLITLEPVELSGDPLDYWYFVKQWFYGGEFGSFDHHDARFGIHIWLFAVQLIFGESAQYTYLAPLIVQTLVIALSYVLTRKISTRAAAVAVGLVLCEFDPFIRASSQIRPGMFSAMYVLAAALSLVAYARARPEKRFVPLACVVGSMLLAYLTKLPDLFFTPAVLFVMYFTQRRLKDVGFFFGLLIAGFFLESLVHYFAVGGTRITSSFGRGSGPELRVYSDLLLRLTRYLDDPCKLVLYPFMVSGPALLALTARKKNFPVALIIVLLPASFIVTMTFGVRSLDPVQALQPFHPRYFNGVIPLCVIASVVVVQTVIKELWRTTAPKLGSWARLASPALSAAIVLVLFFAHTSALLKIREARKEEVHPYVQAKRAFVTLSDAYARKLAIVGPSDKLLGKSRFPRSPPLHWSQKGFIKSELLLNEAGKLPRFSYRMTARIAKRSRTMYLPRSLETSSVEEAYRARECVVRLIRRDRFVTVIPGEGVLPAHCESQRKLTREERKQRRKEAWRKKRAQQKAAARAQRSAERARRRAARSKAATKKTETPPPSNPATAAKKKPSEVETP